VDAVMLHELGQDDLAIDRLTRATKSDKQFSPAYSLLGRIYEDMQQYADSAAAYEKAIELNPFSCKDNLHLGRVSAASGDYSKAATAYGAACELCQGSPERFQACLGAAEILYKLGNRQQALARALTAQQAEPNDFKLQKLLGDIYADQKQFPEAVTAYENALRADGNDPNVMMSLALAYIKTDEIGSATELLKRLVAIQPGRAQAYQYLGYCYLQQQDVDNAIDSYQRAVAINENDWQALRGLGVAYMLKSLQQGDGQAQLRAKAVQQWQLSLDVNPNQSRAEQLRRLIRKYSQQR